MSIASPAEKFNSLDLALDYVARYPGRYLFPIKAGAKFPPLLRDNLEKASNDPKQLAAWAKKWPGANWGLALKKSNIFAVDVDTKPGKFGQATYDELDLLYGFPPTGEITRTPTGGFHYIFEGPHIFALGTRGLGLDIDSPNYILIAGCTVKDGKSYEAIGDGSATASAPQWFYDVISQAKVKVQNSSVAAVELDKENAIAWAIDYLRNDAAPSIEGKGGEFQTLKVSMSLRDNGISEPRAVELMNQFYNVPGLCEPEWTIEELTVKVRNAYAYASMSQIGGKTAEADFAADDVKVAADSITPQGDSKKIERESSIRAVLALKQKAAAEGIDKDKAKKLRAAANAMMKDKGLKAADLKPKAPKLERTAKFDQFWAYLPEHKYFYVPTRDLWPAASIDSVLGKGASTKLDITRPIQKRGWAPGKPLVIFDRILEDTGWIDQPGANTFNTYRAPPVLTGGDAEKGKRWAEHVRKIFPDDCEHLTKWIAHLVRNPGRKINHALVVGSEAQGIGKDTIFAPILQILGSWNCKEVSASRVMEEPTFNPYLEALFCRINEAHAEGNQSRTFYEHRKNWLASPPEALDVADKNVKVHAVLNVLCIVISTNHLAAMYMPATDRRHYVAWSYAKQTDFEDDYFPSFYKWIEEENGAADVAAYLATIDLSGFDPKASPPKTPAFWQMVNSNQPSDTNELGDLIEHLGNPDALTIEQLMATASSDQAGQFDSICQLMMDSKSAAKKMPTKLLSAGYVSVHNGNGTRKGDGRFRVGGKRVTVYARATLEIQARLDAAEALAKGNFVSDAEAQRLRRAERAAVDKLNNLTDDVVDQVDAPALADLGDQMADEPWD